MRIGYRLNFPKLYKYINSSYIDSTLNEGRFRIGTLWEYQLHENKEVMDEFEGRKSYVMPNGEAERTVALNKLIKDRELRGFFKHPSFEQGDLEEIFKENIPVAIVETAPDAYIYCMTEQYDLNVMKSFGCDAILEINEPNKFLGALALSMDSYAQFAALNKCVYANKFGVHDQHNDIDPLVLKERHYAHQREVRIIFDARREQEFPLTLENMKLEPLFVVSPAAAKLCRQVYP